VLADAGRKNLINSAGMRISGGTTYDPGNCQSYLKQHGSAGIGVLTFRTSRIYLGVGRIRGNNYRANLAALCPPDETNVCRFGFCHRANTVLVTGIPDLSCTLARIYLALDLELRADWLVSTNGESRSV
jgi:hypothetical protein